MDNLEKKNQKEISQDNNDIIDKNQSEMMIQKKRLDKSVNDVSSEENEIDQETVDQKDGKNTSQRIFENLSSLKKKEEYSERFRQLEENEFGKYSKDKREKLRSIYVKEKLRLLQFISSKLKSLHEILEIIKSDAPEYENIVYEIEKAEKERDQILDYESAIKIYVEDKDVVDIVDEINKKDGVILARAYMEEGVTFFIAPEDEDDDNSGVEESNDTFKYNNDIFNKLFLESSKLGFEEELSSFIRTSEESVAAFEQFGETHLAGKGGFKEVYSLGDSVRSFEKETAKIEKQTALTEEAKENFEENKKIFGEFSSELNLVLGNESPFVTVHTEKWQKKAEGKSFKELFTKAERKEKIEFEFFKNFSLSLLESYSILNNPKQALENIEDETKKKSIDSAISKTNYEGLQHGDVNEGNIFITPEGKVTIIDIGDEMIGKGQKSNIGVPEYMPLEKFNNTVSDNSDVYSLGILLYKLYGSPDPFPKKETLTIIYEKMSVQADGLLPKTKDCRIEGLSKKQKREIAQLIQKMTIKDVDKRLTTVEAYEELKKIFQTKKKKKSFWDFLKRK